MPRSGNGLHHRVLIVEDDPSSRKALMMLLKREGHQVEGADSARRALAKLAENQPEIVILDLMLPDGLGIAVLQEIRTQNLRTRVAILTGVEDPQKISEVTDFEPDAIFTKPLNLDALTDWIRVGDLPA